MTDRIKEFLQDAKELKTKHEELSEEELSQINGGYGVTSVTYDNKESVVFKWNIDDYVEKIRAYAFLHVFTRQCRIVDRKADVKPNTQGFCTWYKVTSDDDDYNNRWFAEDEFEHGYESIYPNIVM